MVKIHIDYEGSLRCRLTHGPSQSQFITDAPTDNMGKGEAFSPTDLVASALGSCMLTVMGIAAAKQNIPFDQATVDLEKEMIALPVRRIKKISVKIQMPAGLNAEQRKILEHAAHSCPVHKSLHPDLETPIEFFYPA